MKSRQVITPQLRSALRQIELLLTSTVSDRPLAVIHGPAGSGKTTLARIAAATYPRATMVRLDALLTARSMLQKIFTACCGWHLDHHDTRAVYERLIEELRARRSILLLDESDNLLRGDRFNMLDVVRDLADTSGARIVMFSARRLAARLRGGAYASDTFSSRLHFQMEFQRPSLDDAALLAKELLEVTIDRDLLEDCWERAAGSYRSLMAEFADVERVAIESEMQRLNLARWRELTMQPTAGVVEGLGAGVVRPIRATKAI